MSLSISWEDCKQLLLSHNFFESLRFFDRDNVPKHKLQKLEKMVTKRSELVSVQHGSRAVVPICLWVEALVDYHKAKMVVEPYRDRLTEAEGILMDVRMGSKFFEWCNTYACWSEALYWPNTLGDYV